MATLKDHHQAMEMNMNELKLKFEEWFDDNMYIGSKCISDPETKRRMFCSWIAAWQASRAAIEIKLPDIEVVTGNYTAPGDGWEVYDAQETDKAIRAAGIKVKE